MHDAVCALFFRFDIAILCYRHVQCVLNFADNHAEDGGTIVVPYFHRFLAEWNEREKSIRKPLPWVTLPKNIEERYMPYAQRISMKEASKYIVICHLFQKEVLFVSCFVIGLSSRMGPARVTWHLSQSFNALSACTIS